MEKIGFVFFLGYTHIAEYQEEGFFLYGFTAPCFALFSILSYQS
jgi:hypothetical protein